MWSVADIADAVEAGLKRENARLAREQAVYGLDALDELSFHPVLARILRTTGYGVHREKRYPAHRHFRNASEGDRCDFVLTPDGRDLREPDKAATLFDPADALPLDEAFWLEIKLAWQFTTEDPNHRYAAQMLNISRADIAKLQRDPLILHAGLALIAFVQDEDVARHDLTIWYQRCIERGLPLGYPSMRFVPITNRLGNATAAVAIGPVAHL